MNIIVAADNNWGIGKRGELLVSIPQDKQLFRQMTEGNVIVTGRKTFETFPGKRPLMNRTNIILTQNMKYSVKGAVVVHSVEELFTELEKYDSKDVYIVGGGEIYKQMLPYCDTAYVTFIDYRYDADAFFPALSNNEWKLVEESEEQTYFDVEYYYRKYIRR